MRRAGDGLEGNYYSAPASPLGTLTWDLMLTLSVLLPTLSRPVKGLLFRLSPQIGYWKPREAVYMNIEAASTFSSDLVAAMNLTSLFRACIVGKTQADASAALVDLAKEYGFSVTAQDALGMLPLSRLLFPPTRPTDAPDPDR